MIAYSYDDANRMTATTLPSGTGIVSSFSYDNADRLTGISHVKNGSTTIASVAYTLDDGGNRTQRVDQQGTHTYAYDDLYRLTSVTYPGPSTTSYTFDAFGNRTSMTDASGTTDYTYDDADRLTEVDPPSASAVAYTWDDNGNLTDRGSDEFEWDEADRMVSATVNSATTTFAYRGDGLRESRTVGMSTTTFTWDVNAGLPVVLYDGSSYLYGFGLEAMEQSGDWYYFLADGLGSTMAIVDDAGAVQNRYTYDVYGEPTVTGSLANEFDFAGQQTDADTGLQYLRARYMDPETGVFLSREPLGTDPGWTAGSFSYSGNDPVGMADPTGLSPVSYSANEAEKTWCKQSVRNASRCYEVNRVGDEVTALVKEKFGEDEDDSPANAFKHCCWIGLVSLKYGHEDARNFGERHESLTFGEILSKGGMRHHVMASQMDLHNNEQGIAYARASMAACRGGSWAMCTAAAKNDVIRRCLEGTKNGDLITNLRDPRIRRPSAGRW